jgi:hypothetical protein
MRVVVAVCPKGYEDKYPWKHGDALLLLGDIESMPGHVVVADKTGRVHWAYDADSFREAREDEL